GGKGHRKGTFGALVLGQYDPASGALVHIGQTGGGLRDTDLRLLQQRLRPLVTKTSPFKKAPETLQPATWVKPQVVVEVEYSEFTPDGALRAPVFLGVRDDIEPSEVRWAPPAPSVDSEKPAMAAAPTPSAASSNAERATGRGKKPATSPPPR